MASQTAIVVVRLFTKLAWGWFLANVGSSVDFDKLYVDKLVMAKATIGKLVDLFVHMLLSQPKFKTVTNTGEKLGCD